MKIFFLFVFVVSSILCFLSSDEDKGKEYLGYVSIISFLLFIVEFL